MIFCIITINKQFRSLTKYCNNCQRFIKKQKQLPTIQHKYNLFQEGSITRINLIIQQIQGSSNFQKFDLQFRLIINFLNQQNQRRGRISDSIMNFRCKMRN
ncbi:unnamed protein product [Paramecium sonneborni]|uniref:Uncharacterized protein n=1 Tax=Paramecium sonneborni TaxID=65129 RepID=A0A8S1MMV5_9CILI|nr:unnamed protein product [Paramecium sonneborni]